MSGLRQFGIESWSAWAPGLATSDAWQAYFAAPFDLPDESADVSFLPAMQRRRLSPLARAAFYASYHALNGDNHCPTIYCSSRGELQRAENILLDIARGDDMSPTAFGLSVHNAIGGQFSILFANKEPMVAVAPMEADYLSAFIDALGHLNEGKTSVLLVFYEEAAPGFFAPYCKDANFPYALALKITRPQADKKSWQLDYTENAAAEESLPSLLQLVRFIVQSQPHIHLGNWRIS